MRDIDFGKVRLKLEEIRQAQHISINKLAFRAEMQRSQVRGYCKNEIQRLDLAILARLCYALDCDIVDLIEYIPPESAENDT